MPHPKDLWPKYIYDELLSRLALTKLSTTAQVPAPRSVS